MMLWHRIVGGVPSWTVTLKVQVEELPDSSVAEQLSVAVALKLTTPLHLLRSFVVTISAGRVRRGSSASRTVTVKLQVVVLPEESVAVQWTVVTPFGKTNPDSGWQAKVIPGKLSAAVAA